MRAVLLHAHGGLDALHYTQDQPLPEPQAGQVRVRLHAAALNRLDWWVRTGEIGIKIEFPHILGADGAGVIDKLGAGVTGWEVGQRVALDPGEVDCAGCEFCDRGMENLCRHYQIIGEHNQGTYCEYRLYPVRNLLALPDEVSFATAAAASLVYLTAWHSLIVRGNLRPGESVLIVGAGGGVNTASLQIAHMLGCTTYVVGSNTAKCAQAEELGADFVFNRSQDPDWGKALFKATQKRGVDVAVDNVGSATLNTSLRAVRNGGRVLTVGNTSGAKFELDNRYIFARQVALIGSTMGTHADFVDVMRLVFAGKLAVPIGAQVPLEESREAHRLLEAGETFGKIVLDI